MESVEYSVECYYKEDEIGYFCINGKFKEKIPDYYVEGNSARKCPKCGKRERLAYPPLVYPNPYEDGIVVEADVKCLACGFTWIERTYIEEEEKE